MGDVLQALSHVDWPQTITAVTSIVGGFAILATLTPNKADDKIAQVLLDGINFLGGNIGKAKNDPAKQ